MRDPKITKMQVSTHRDWLIIRIGLLLNKLIPVSAINLTLILVSAA